MADYEVVISENLEGTIAPDGGPVTLAFARARLNMWLAVESTVATGQSYRIGQRELTRVSLPSIVERINFWQSEVTRLARGARRGARVFRVIPRDL